MRLPHSPTAAGNSTKLPGDHNPTKALHAWSSSQPAQRSLRALARYPHFEPIPRRRLRRRRGRRVVVCPPTPLWNCIDGNGRNPPRPRVLCQVFEFNGNRLRQEVFLPTRPGFEWRGDLLFVDHPRGRVGFALYPSNSTKLPRAQNPATPFTHTVTVRRYPWFRFTGMALWPYHRFFHTFFWDGIPIFYSTDFNGIPLFSTEF